MKRISRKVAHVTQPGIEMSGKKKKFFCQFSFEMPESEVALFKKTWQSLGGDSNASIQEIFSDGRVFIYLAEQSQGKNRPPIKNFRLNPFDEHEGV